MKRCYQIAEKIIAIDSLYHAVHRLCEAYLCAPTDSPDILLKMTPDDLEQERRRAAAQDRLEGFPDREYGLPYLETLAVYRKMTAQMLPYDILLMHGSAAAIDGEAYLFTAKSGTGKSTHTRLWREAFGDRVVMVNDDKPLLKITDQGVTVYGTPWNGKHRLGENISAPLKAICILSRDETNHIEPVSARDAMIPLLKQVNFSDTPEGARQTLRLLDRLMRSVRLYRLGCNTQPDAALVAYRGMNT